MRLIRVAIFAMAACPSLAGALNYDIVERGCIGGPAAPPMFEKTVPVPVGCEVIDCCPGCPGSVALERLKLGKGAKRLEDRVLLSRGTITIGGIPYDPTMERAVANLKPMVNAASAEALKSSTTDRITVRQYLHGSLVNRFQWSFATKPCAPPAPPPTRKQDRLVIKNIPAGEDVIVMMDARKAGGCVDGAAGAASEWVFRSTGVSRLGNVLSAGSCRSEIAIFSKSRAMYLESPVTAWTDAPGDVHTVSLQPRVKIVVHIWVRDDATAAIANNHMLKATALFDSNPTGIEFVPTIKKLSDVSSDPSAFQIVKDGISTDGSTCQDLAAIQAQPFYVAKALNVYYVDDAFTGKNCAIKPTPAVCTTSSTSFPAGDANMTFLGTAATSTTLAHEFGHAFGLRPASCQGHTNGVPGFGPDNIMWAGGGDERQHFTLGQIFRMHVQIDNWGGTMLIPDSTPAVVGRACAPNVHDAACPALKLDSP